MAQAFADRVLAEAGEIRTKQIERAYWLALSRPPVVGESEAFEKLMTDNLALYKDRQNAPREALVEVCRVLLNLNEFVYVD
jgi:hypothetical protein